MDKAVDLGTDRLLSRQQQQDASLVKLANSILSQLHVNQKISSISQINGSLFVTMYEGLCGELLPDAIRNPKSLEDDIQNAQSVVDALALEVLHTSLSHISGEAVAKGDRTAIANLLDLFSSLMEFILNRIECDLSDEEDIDTDQVTNELIDEILSRDIKDVSIQGKENYEADDDSDAENGGGVERGRSSTLDLIIESEEIEKRLLEEEKRCSGEEDIRFEGEISRCRVLENVKREKRRRKEEEMRLVEEALARYGEKPTKVLDLSADSYVGDSVEERTPVFESSPKHDCDVSLSHTTPFEGHFSNLLSLTEETCELSRSAIRNSPARARAERSAFLEAAIRSALKKIDNEAKGMERLVEEVPKTKSVRLKLTDQFSVDIPRKLSPYQPKPLADNNNADEGIPRPSVTIYSPSRTQKVKKSAKVQPFSHKKQTAVDTVDYLKRLYAYDYRSILDEEERMFNKEKRSANTIERNMWKCQTKTRKSRRPAPGKAEFSDSSPIKCPHDFLPKDSNLFWLMEAFPNLYLSTDTMHDLWQQSVKQIEQLGKIEQETKKKNVLHKQLEQAARRQNLVSEIFRKDLEHRKRMAEINERRAQKKAVKQSIQEKRAQSARIRRYYQEFQLRMRAKMLNKRIRDELIFKKVFKDGLAIQRQCIRDMRRYAKEQREKKSIDQQNEIESLENFYRDQFMILAESAQKERMDLASRQKAQNRVINRMKRELRYRMETEIRNIQAQLIEDDDGHFRQLDADALRDYLLQAKYKSSV